jgi:hypothetical protein
MTTSIKELYPTLDTHQQAEAEDNLSRYLEFVLQFQRRRTPDAILTKNKKDPTIGS